MKRLVILCAIAACHGHGAVEATSSLEAPKDAITKPVENGPAKVTEKVWPAKPNLGEPIYLQLEIQAASGVTVDAPFQEAGDARLGRFKVTSFSRGDARRDADGTQHQLQTYTLEAAQSGKQRIPPLRLEMIDTRANAGSAANKAQELLTDEIPLDIAPVKTEAIGAPLRGATGKLDPDVGGPPWLWIGLGVSILMVFGAGGVLLYRGAKSRNVVAARRSAYEEAVARLTALEEVGAPDRESADAWFVQLSAIVRRYLEQRYEIRAPELTTEEFLNVATQNPNLKTDHRALLTAFLERCDRVKFAGYRPDSDESLATLKAARAFVEDTKLREGVAA